MTEFAEGRQRLTLAPYWETLKWDEAEEHVGPLQNAFTDLIVDAPRSVKAADVIATALPNAGSPTLLVAELKDFAHPDMTEEQRVAAAETAKSHHLISDVVAKVLDSLAGVTFAHDKAQARCSELDTWRTAVGDRDAEVVVLLCIELPKKTALLAVLQTEFKKRLRWLGPRSQVIVTSAPHEVKDVRYTLS